MVEQSNVLMILHNKRDLECIYSNKFTEILESPSDSYHRLGSWCHSYSEAQFWPMIEYITII